MFRFHPLLLLVLVPVLAEAQQVPDSTFTYAAARPAYAIGAGPRVVVDEAHHNFHRIGERYMAFANVVRGDGYQLTAGTEPFTTAGLQDARILVISNALGDDGPWQLPTVPAFTADEVHTVEAWVRAGGSLFLIADHMPFGGAAAEMAAAFGFNWINGYAFRKDNGPEQFSRTAGNLLACPITDGSTPDERIDRITLFTGSAFVPPPEARPIIRLGEDYEILLPQQAGQFSDTTARIDGRYFHGGAMLEYGSGRVVCSSEAAMFSAQLAGPTRQPMGMNQPEVGQNAQFLINIIHWLDKRL